MIAFLMGLVVGVVIGRFVQIPRPQRAALKSWRWVDDEYELTFADGRVYRGRSTVWHAYPSGERAGVRTESWLSDVEQGIKYREGAEGAP